MNIAAKGTEQDSGPGRPLSPKWWGIIGALLGLAAFAAILATGDPKAPFGESLGNALTAFLGCVVAGWGITQAEIAHEARDAANNQANAAALQVIATHEQLELQRVQIADADKEAKRAQSEAQANRDHADRTLRATIKQRLDAQAPRVLISTEPAISGGPLYEWRDGGASYIDAPSTPPSEWFTEIPDQPIKMNESTPRNIQVRVRIGLRFTLLGDVPARIECVSIENHDLIGMPNPLILGPRQREAIVEWVKVINASGDYAAAGPSGQQSHGLIWRPRFWVRDLAMNTLDEFVLSGSIGVMRRNGDYMNLTPEGVSLGGAHAEQLPRRYEYFDSQEGKSELGVPE